MQIEDQILSQRLSQLSTTHDHERGGASMKLERQQEQTTSPIKRKKFRSDPVEKETMPYYLLAKNNLFDPMIQQTMDRTCTLDMEEIRDIAFCMHYKATYETLYHLWSLYLRSGTGQLKENNETTYSKERCYWSKHVQALLCTTHPTTQEDQQEAYELLVNQRMQHYSDNVDYYEKEVNDKEYTMIGLTSTIKRTVETCVKQYGMTALRMKCDFAIALLYYDYDDHLLQVEYEQAKPTEDQVK